MTATNHALTGALIGLIVHDPLIAIPAAIASHFVCDAIPHFDKSNKVSEDAWLKSSKFKRILLLDTSLCVALVLSLLILSPEHWILASVCAFFATSPDLLWFGRYRKVNKNKQWKPNLLLKFASKIQWFAKPIGGVVEAVWFVGGIILIGTIIR
jgi:hypothetical protein